MHEHHAEIVVGVGVVNVECDGTAVVLDGLGAAAKIIKDVRQVVVDVTSNRFGRPTRAMYGGKLWTTQVYLTNVARRNISRPVDRHRQHPLLAPYRQPSRPQVRAEQGWTCFRGAPFGSSDTSLIGTSTLGSAGHVTIPDVLKTAQQQGKTGNLRILAGLEVG